MLLNACVVSFCNSSFDPGWMKNVLESPVTHKGGRADRPQPRCRPVASFPEKTGVPTTPRPDCFSLINETLGLISVPSALLALADPLESAASAARGSCLLPQLIMGTLKCQSGGRGLHRLCRVILRSLTVGGKDAF